MEIWAFIKKFINKLAQKFRKGLKELTTSRQRHWAVLQIFREHYLIKINQMVTDRVAGDLALNYWGLVWFYLKKRCLRVKLRIKKLKKVTIQSTIILLLRSKFTIRFLTQQISERVSKIKKFRILLLISCGIMTWAFIKQTYQKIKKIIMTYLPAELLTKITQHITTIFLIIIPVLLIIQRFL